MHTAVGILLLFVVDAQCQVCTSGTTYKHNETSPYYNITNGQFLDLDNPITCSGNVTSIQYCYHSHNSSNSSQSVNSSMNFLVRVWRAVGNGSYTKAHEYQIEENTPTQKESSLFVNVQCMSLTLNSSEYFHVLNGDILGIYFEDSGLGILAINKDTSSTDAMAESSSNVGLHYDIRSIGEVRDGTTLTSSDLRIKVGVNYHLQVQIGKLNV